MNDSFFQRLAEFIWRDTFSMTMTILSCLALITLIGLFLFKIGSVVIQLTKWSFLGLLIGAIITIILMVCHCPKDNSCMIGILISLLVAVTAFYATQVIEDPTVLTDSKEQPNSGENKGTD